MKKKSKTSKIKEKKIVDHVDARNTVIDLKLTKFEAIHLRDLFGVTLAVDMKTTVSQALANAADRPMVEAKLWQKIAKACKSAKISMNEEAPDFVVAASAPPPVGVFQLANEPGGDQQSAIESMASGLRQTGLFEEENEDDDTV
jgi:hypothetical protein